MHARDDVWVVQLLQEGNLTNRGRRDALVVQWAAFWTVEYRKWIITTMEAQTGQRKGAKTPPQRPNNGGNEETTRERAVCRPCWKYMYYYTTL